MGEFLGSTPARSDGSRVGRERINCEITSSVAEMTVHALRLIALICRNMGASLGNLH